jgi:hypothetical protein
MMTGVEMITQEEGDTAAARRKQRAPGMPRLFATDHGLVARAAIAPP